MWRGDKAQTTNVRGAHPRSGAALLLRIIAQALWSVQSASNQTRCALTRRAGQAGGDCRVVVQARGGDFVAALDAEAKFTLVQTRQRRGNAQFQLIAANLRGFCHFLLLHRVHARQPADGLLVKRHCALAVLSARILTLNIPQHVAQTVADIFQVIIIHFQNWRHQPLCFGETDYL